MQSYTKMHSFHQAQSTYLGLNWSCSKSCVCVAGKDLTWGVTTPGDQRSWWLLTSYQTPCSSVCGFMGPETGFQRQVCCLHHVRGAHSEMHVWLSPISTPWHEHVTDYHTGWGPSTGRVWVTTRAPIPWNTWEICSYLLMSVTWSHVTAWEIKETEKLFAIL